jgi:hypothetical protein
MEFKFVCAVPKYFKCFTLSQDLLLIFMLLGYVVAQLVEALRYKREGRGIDFRWGYWGFSLT